MFCRSIIFVILGIGFLITDARPPRKVVGGTDAEPGELKYQVALTRRGFQFCGGALISRRHVLTAAHCFPNGPETTGIVVLSGTTSIKTGGEIHYLKHVAIHPEYNAGNKTRLAENDIAVITLEEPVKKTDLQAPINLPSSYAPFGAVGLVSGWGQQNRGTIGLFPEILQKKNVTTLSNRLCSLYWPIYSTQICGFDGAGNGFCDGDSGGPLVYQDEIIGVVSMATGICGIGKPDIYTRVASYLDFINREMQRQ